MLARLKLTAALPCPRLWFMTVLPCQTRLLPSTTLHDATTSSWRQWPSVSNCTSNLWYVRHLSRVSEVAATHNT